MRKKAEHSEVDVVIGLAEGRQWNKSKIKEIKAFAGQAHAGRTPKRVMINRLLSIKYRMEDYVNSNDPSQYITLEMFLKDSLHALNLPLKRFAVFIDTTDGNLKKYLSGERKFNVDLAMKFASFFHTPADLWLRVSIKNEIMDLQNEREKCAKYKKYDFEKVMKAELSL
jgi:plasmid maintenance system antidote protein VapI